MGNKERLLIIFFRPPFPLFGGDKIRMFQIMKVLSKIYNIDVLFLNEEKTQQNTISEIKKWATNIFPFDIKKSSFYLNTFKGFFLNRKPLQVNYYTHKIVQDWIDENISNYNLVFCSTIRTTEYVLDKPVFKIVDFIDSISMNYDKAIKNRKIGLWKIMYLIDKKRLRKYERIVLHSFNKNIIISDVDRRHILMKDEKFDIKVIPNSIELNKNNYTIEEQNVISFIGKMDYEPNRVAVVYFSKKVFPYILQKHPDINFNIIGINPTREVKKLSLHKGINVLGYVEDMNQSIIGSKLIVAPMITGAGLQNKILQSMALEKCVVTTSIGAEGLPGVTNKQIVIADNSIKTAERISVLLNNRSMRERIGINARKYVKENFSEDKIETELLKYLLR